MKVGIVGGALQGMEAVFLSKKAGFETLVVDRRGSAPAASLADSFVECDVCKDPFDVAKVLSDCDVVLPALEELDALHELDRILSDMDVPFLFDMHSYELSCSKERSNALMAGIGVPLPRPWPECGYPIIVKPSSQSGSIGVSVAENDDERERALRIVDALDDVPIQQEFVSGKSVSIEVIGNGSEYRSYVTTEVVLDRNYDCKMVVCEPGVLDPSEEDLFGNIGRSVAESMGLRALMDVEAIATKKGLRVLEIDARIPSQTPAAIQAATGVNLLEELVASTLGKPTGRSPSGGCSVYEHYLIRDGNLITCGEKEFGHVDSPYIAERMFGADEVITDYMPGKSEWRATVINRGDTPSDVLEKRKAFIGRVMSECDLDEYVDLSPEMLR